MDGRNFLSRRLLAASVGAMNSSKAIMKEA